MDDNEFSRLFEASKTRKVQAEIKKGEASKKRLEEETKKRMKTIFIGAIDAIEKEMGSLWSGDSQANKEFKKMFLNVRKRILDIGNDQANFFKEDLENYDIKFKQFNYIFPVIEEQK